MTSRRTVMTRLTAWRALPIQAGIQTGALVSALLLAACASKPVPPDWQANAFAALHDFSTAYLSGNVRLADFELARATSEIARTGRADLLARAELTRCAVRVASLEFDHCAAYQPLAADATASEQAYAAFLSGHWSGLDATLLPAHYQTIVLNAAAGSPAQANSLLDTIDDPLARLVAAGVLLQGRRLTPADMVAATETASAQGWRRPLLAWLGVQLKHADAAGNQNAMARIQRRIDLILQAPPKAQ